MQTRLFCSAFSASLLLLQLPTTVQAQKISKQLDVLTASYAKAGQFNGTVLVAEKGKVVFAKGYGLANREWDQPNAPDTKFRLGSLTKQFTSMLVMQLVEKGQLKLDAHITDYLPDYPKAGGDKITLHHLLTHTSGIPNYTAQPNFRNGPSIQPTTPVAFVSTFSAMPLEFEPGSKFNYSNSGYFLLGAIVEKVTGKPYAQVLTENILQPLHMQDTGYDLAGTILPKRATGYEKTPTGMANSAYLDMTVPYAAGSLYSTVLDLYKWDQALYTNQLLSEANKALLFKDFKSGYAYGWNIGKSPMGPDTVAVQQHGGGINGFRTFLLRAPKDHHLVVVLDNEGGPKVSQLSADLLKVLYRQPATGPKPEPVAPKAIAVDAATLAGYVGKYALAPTFILTVTVENAQLYVQATGQPRFGLVPTAAGRFFAASVPAELEFVKKPSGEVEKVILHQGGKDSPGAKIE